MKPEEFTKFEDELPAKTKWIIVTNNINAENNYSEMSHVWLTSIWHTDNAGKILMYDGFNGPILNLTHWKYA
jgi:hypothetical protein